MTKTAQAWMPLYIGDYLGDTARLTTEQHGAYLLLMMDYWRNGPPPDDDDVLQQIAKMDKPAWRKCRLALAGMFRIAEGKWHHKRIDQELAAAESNADRRSERAKTAAAARWSSDAKSNAPSNATSMPGALLGECPPPSPIANNYSSSTKPRATMPLDRAEPDEAEQHCRAVAAEIRLIRPIGPADRLVMQQWLRDGLRFDWHILPGVQRVAAREEARGQTIRSFKYLDQGVREYHAEWLADLERLKA